MENGEGVPQQAYYEIDCNKYNLFPQREGFPYGEKIGKLQSYNSFFLHRRRPHCVVVRLHPARRLSEDANGYY